MPHATPTTDPWTRHDPTATAVYERVRANLASFQRFAEERSGRPLPTYVTDEFAAYLRCGVLACGFVRARCPGCGFDRLVAFSCKHRGVCSSCGARRMSETAANLVDRVWPDVPMRQWVLSVPWELRLPLARDPKLLARLARIFFEELRRWSRDASGVTAREGEHLEVGCVTHVQRFGGSLNLNVHLHVLAADGVFRCREDGTTPVFVTGRADA